MEFESSDSRHIEPITGAQFVEFLSEIRTAVSLLNRQLSDLAALNPVTEKAQTPPYMLQQRTFWDGSNRVDLSETEALILEKLLDADGRTVGKAALCAVLGLNEQQHNNVRVYVYRLRNKLRKGGISGHVIESVRDLGYRALRASESAA